MVCYSFSKLFLGILLYSFVKLVPIANPGLISGSGNYPKAVLIPNDKSLIIFVGSKPIQFTLASGINTAPGLLTLSHTVEVGGLATSSFVAVTSFGANTFKIITGSSSYGYLPNTNNGNPHPFTNGAPICLFNFPSGVLGYAVWVYNQEIYMLSFDSNNNEIYNKEYLGRHVGNNIHCKGFSSNQFICVYTGKETTDNDGCFIHVFSDQLEQLYSERELYSEGCFGSPAQKIFQLDETTNNISKYTVIMGYRSNQ